MAFFNTDTKRSVEEILEDVRIAAQQGVNQSNPVLAITPFASLLVKLSQGLDNTSLKVVWLTRWLIGLTGVLTIFTLALVFEALR